ncbi:hypothetical protein AXF42_Ash016190 [Apostasia shenzhenica]|uniref:Uncharacterized protein n=1 Tax=Apostasia shenzhenica TaxID=1088818 RepID=A0A2I0AEU0_9ASPA|nr:hypothetical protein AXF42_Ash016190 [Apostasia shenzhenica]
MSRCSPYHPRGYEREDVSVIRSIKKLQNRRGNGLLNEEKFRKNEIFSKKRSREENGKQDSLENNKKKRRHDKKAAHPHESFHHAGKNSCEQLEGSGLTEEHEAPASLLNSCPSSESTQNSSQMTSVVDSQVIRRSHGLVLRIKLPLKKHTDKNLQPASTGCSRQISEIILGSKLINSTKLQDSQPLPATEDPCCSDRIAESSVPQLEVGSIGSCSTPELERSFRDLILNWKPPSLQLDEKDMGDEDWLFSTHRSRRIEPIAKNLQVGVSDRTACSADAGSSLQPRACYLPDCDILQLPYVVPF